MIPDIAVPAVRRLLERGKAGRQCNDGRLYSQLINGDRGGYPGNVSLMSSVGHYPGALPHVGRKPCDLHVYG
jgi:hypothetical protein